MTTEEVMQNTLELAQQKHSKTVKPIDPYLDEFTQYKPPFRLSRGAQIIDANNNIVSSHKRRNTIDKAVDEITEKHYWKDNNITISSLIDFRFKLADIMTEFWELYVIPQLPNENK